MINQSRLKELLSYNKDTGAFIWLVTRSHARAGQPAGWIDGDGYLQIRADGVLYQAHRLAWLYVTGEWPKGGFIDHKNGTVCDNSFANLRDATKRVNQENRRRAAKNNKVGLLGVSPNGKRFAATINSRGRHYHLGTFDDPQEAYSVYVEAKRKLHAGCTL